MYRIFVVVFIALMFSCNSGKNNAQEGQEEVYDSINGPYMQFVATSLDLGEITQGKKVNCTFHFKNSGKADLIIESVTAGCGCTSTEWEPKPIKVGGESDIKITFNSSGKKGKQNKMVYVKSNASDKEKILKFTCNVVIPN
jgi:hypothetical protein